MSLLHWNTLYQDEAPGDGAGAGAAAPDAAAAAAAAAPDAAAAAAAAAAPDAAAAAAAKEASLIADPTAAAAKEVADAAAAKAAATPETYADFTAPDGMELNAESVTALQAFGQEHKLSQEAAQQVVDMGTKLLGEWQQGQIDQKVAQRTEWVTNARADKEFGGDKLAENLGKGKAAMEKFGTPELLKMANETGVGDHPEFIRFCYRVAQATGCDTLPEGRTSAGSAGVEGTVFTYGKSDHQK